jgi:chemotaxis signal transduction protein
LPDDLINNPDLEKESGNQSTYLIGRVRDCLIALPINVVKGVNRLGHLTPLPGSPGPIAGVLYFRGGIEAAIDVGMIWGKESLISTKKSMQVLVESEGLRGVFLFDVLLDMVELSDSMMVRDYPKEEACPDSEAMFAFNGEKGWILTAAEVMRRFVHSDV